MRAAWLLALLAERLQQEAGLAKEQAEGFAWMAIDPGTMSEHWTGAVETWVGMEVELGAMYDLELDEQRGTLEVSERIACHPADHARRCIRLRGETSRQGEHGSEALSGLTDQMLGESAAPSVPSELGFSLGVDETFELVTEPERLVPHRYWIRREMRIDVTLQGMRRGETTVEETEHRYRY